MVSPQRLGRPSRSNGRRVVFVLALLVLWVFVTPPSVASAIVLKTNSSANCENPDSGAKFSCSVAVTSGDLIIVFAGCLASGGCKYAGVADSQGNTYTHVLGVDSQCGTKAADCDEEAFTARASSTGTDTLTFTANVTGYLGADVYAVTGYVSMPTIAAETSMQNLIPSTGSISYVQGSLVVAGVIANSASQFMGGKIDPIDSFSMIAGQPCFSCGQVGGWQASEYNQGLSYFPTYTAITPSFDYPTLNSGWAMIALEFPSTSAPDVSLSCSPSPVVIGSATRCSVVVHPGSAGATPTGDVSWSSNDNGTFSPSSCVLSSGSCSVYYSPSSVKSPVTITAKYGGDFNYLQNSSTFSLGVRKATSATTVSCSPSPETVGAQTTCTATVAGYSPTGTVTWASSGVAYFSPAGTCTLSAGSCAVGYTPSTASSPVTITGSYGGDGNNTAGSGVFSLVVTQPQTTSSTAAPTTSTSTPNSATTETTTASTTTPSVAASSSTATSSTVSVTTATTVETEIVTVSAGSSSQSTGTGAAASTTTGAGGGSAGSGPDYVSAGAIAAVVIASAAIVAYAALRRRAGPRSGSPST